MSAPLRVERVGASRLRVHAPEDAGARDRLTTWLSMRPEGAAWRYLPESRTDDGHVRDGVAAQGRLLRALRDQDAVERPAPELQPAVSVAHALEGRARLRLHGPSYGDVRRAAAFVGRLPGVALCEPSVDGASLVVRFDPAQTGAPALAAAVEASDPALWPVAPPVVALAWHARHAASSWAPAVCRYESAGHGRHASVLTAAL